MRWEGLSTEAAERRLKPGSQEPLVLSQLLIPISILRVWHQRWPMQTCHPSVPSALGHE